MRAPGVDVGSCRDRTSRSVILHYHAKAQSFSKCLGEAKFHATPGYSAYSLIHHLHGIVTANGWKPSVPGTLAVTLPLLAFSPYLLDARGEVRLMRTAQTSGWASYWRAQARIVCVVQDAEVL